MILKLADLRSQPHGANGIATTMRTSFLSENVPLMNRNDVRISDVKIQKFPIRGFLWGINSFLHITKIVRFDFRSFHDRESHYLKTLAYEIFSIWHDILSELGVNGYD